MPLIDLDNIRPNAVYDADDIAELFHIHRTSVHRRVFPLIATQRIGRKETTTGEQLIKFARGETVPASPEAA